MYNPWQKLTRDFRQEASAIALCLRDPRTPWFTKLLAGGVVAYALSPLDLILDLIPVFGHLDDLLVVALGIRAVRRLIPAHVLTDCRQRASAMTNKPLSWWETGIVFVLWLDAIDGDHLT